MKQIGKHPERVFTYDGKPIERVSASASYEPSNASAYSTSAIST